MGFFRKQQPQIRISVVDYHEMVTHAVREAPREACGILAMRRDAVMRVHQVANVAADPINSFYMDEDDLDFVNRKIEAMDWKFGVVYHSHPFSNSLPSKRDIAKAWPYSYHVIIGLGQGLEVGAWSIVRGKIKAVTMEVTDEIPSLPRPVY